MNEHVKQYWPIYLAIGLGLVGLLLMMNSGGGASAAASGGLSGSQEASLLASQNNAAAQISQAQIAAQAQQNQGILQAVTSIYGTQSSLQQAADQLQAEEYMAYESALGSMYGANAQVAQTQLQTSAQTQQTSIMANLAQTLQLDQLWQALANGAVSIGSIFAGAPPGAAGAASAAGSSSALSALFPASGYAIGAGGIP